MTPAATTIARDDITGLVLAGGQGRRMGGLDKGLQDYAGRPLVAHAIERLAPQVGPLLISANRHLDAYAGFGHPVLADATADFAGPLAGLLEGLRAAPTRWLLCVPCDVPALPLDLGAQLAAVLRSQGGRAAFAVDADGRAQPLFALLDRGLREPLALALQRGERRVLGWLRDLGAGTASFAARDAFRNLNTRAELAWPGLELREMVDADLAGYKALRDATLLASPGAFVSEAATELRRSAASYAGRLAGGALGACLFSLVAARASVPPGNTGVSGELLGAVTLERETRGRKRHIAHLVGMMVAPDAQRRGIGASLLDAALARLRRCDGIEIVTLSVTSSNAAAIALYARRGFVRYGRLPRALRIAAGQYEDQDLMQLGL
ncbi:MAG: molybdenum cofactor guanylyltransferase [Pelomonas sp.]|nr:molybdenum cofactor guanylyltransferase [Roseateles sp.]